jgi:hypothetical protein
LSFFHDDLRRAVETRYLGSPEIQRAEHRRLAEHFDRRRLEPRAVDELPWQLAEARAWPELHDLLADLDFFDRVWGRDEFGVRGYWSSVWTYLGSVDG